MSVVRDDPRSLPDFRRPAEWGGSGKDPVWGISAGRLGAKLRYRDDPLPDQPLHGVIEPSGTMTLDEYADALADTRDSWAIVRPDDVPE
jgi:hypothetical protein